MEKFKKICLCTTTMQNEPSRLLLEEFVRVVKKSGEYLLTVFQCFEDLRSNHEDDLIGAHIFDAIDVASYDTVILFPTYFEQYDTFRCIADRCRKAGVPVICAGFDAQDCCNINYSTKESFGMLVAHVIEEHGCKNIKVMSGMRDNIISAERNKVCAEVMAAHGLTLSESDIMYGDFWHIPTEEAMEKFFASGEAMPDAFVCCNDSMAMAVCSSLNKHGYRVPEDVIVTGFDGIELEQYHNPRITTAKLDCAELCQKIMTLAEEIIDKKGECVRDVSFLYRPVFSESCGCKKHNLKTDSNVLLDYIQSYNSSRDYEVFMNSMGNRIAADPSLEAAVETVRKYTFMKSAVCLTDDFYNNLIGDADNDDNYTADSHFPQTMHVLVSTILEGNAKEGVTIPSEQILPTYDEISALDENHTMIVIPLHFSGKLMGYIVTAFCPDDHHGERVYTYTVALERCLENIHSHSRMRALNKKLEFMFTHDHLTKIYNRYGFYTNFINNYKSIQESDEKEVFIVSVDLNDMKYINDNFGHSAGDDALCITARSLIGAAEHIGANVISSRFGGDEFVAACVCDGNAAELSQKYRRSFDMVLSELNHSSDRPYKVEVSMGIYAASLSSVETIDALIDLADRLMYNDKAKHKRHPRN